MQDIHILGSGAMGLLWASYFNHSAKITFITRNDVKPSFTFEKRPENLSIATSKTTASTLIKDKKFIKRLIICTKSFDALNALEQLTPCLHDNCEILLIQNGMGSQQAIAEQFSHLAIYACSSTEGVYKKSDDILVHAGHGENHIGSLSADATLQKLTSWLPTAKFQWHQDITPILWKKLVINSAINPLTVIYQCQNGNLLTNETSRNHMIALCAELDTLVTQLNLNLAPTFQLAESVCQSTADNFSSMYQDNFHNRQTEIEYITGYVIKQCTYLDIKCQAHEDVYSQFHS